MADQRALVAAQRTGEGGPLAEAGLPGFDMTTWYAVYVTAGTPPDVVNRVAAEAARIVEGADQHEFDGLSRLRHRLARADLHRGSPRQAMPDEVSH